ncbi:ABC transporter ATP-binding protein [Agrobacterium rhizogenes]|uniref:dipeptide ABC transporter ATP-binding protein n=1 Tax=Rhizobium rhizogenes TaxID=359 RepID=UPI000645D18C|nr:ABC transporter ATP-binding protein [Rhizobium rhizogenes]NTG05246.1 ABC transporter ATP-binding protein [Rhizobium rhizogenes]NTG09536.1 ABC transporter ATP-binding protein [Rhizobium rhizogenes]NTG16390.1 ABC transporter ATP-binding protein [Rhizobium rhizogenes]NTG22548.1 ABC transporter ATP-binding protein [Rhizobium rhizogenes]NTG32372.1 ABC transporter ATP-binding protein [Rhizobium rhizogenes]
MTAEISDKPPLLSLSGIKVEYPAWNRTFVAVENIDLVVRRGEILGLVGESGAGKSTIGSAIMGLLDQPGRITAGTIKLDGEVLDPSNERRMRAIRGTRISMIFQDPMTSLNPLYTIGRQLVETIRAHKPMSAKAAKSKAAELLTAVGISGAETRMRQYPHQFSGGMRQRVVIALALCTDPDLIIADEPTTALDVSVQAQILELIKRLATERNAGVILVTHDMGVIAETTNRVAVMYRGNIVETGETHQIIHAPRHDYTRSLIGAVPRADIKLHRFPETSYGKTEASQPTGFDVSTHWLGRKTDDAIEQADNRPLISIENLGVTFVTRRALLARDRTVFDAVKEFNLDIRTGEVLGLVGESGSGKSTVARVLSGLCHPSSGRVTFKGEDLTAIGGGSVRQAFHRQIQMIFQDPYSSLNPRMRVDAIVAEPIQHHRLAATGAGTQAMVADLLDLVGLGGQAGRKFPHEFSGGQRQRISIARALATRPRFLICDEPTSALDVSIQAQILNLLKDLQETLGLTILFISHDLPVVRQMCDRIAVMNQGQLCETASADDLFQNPQHPYTKQLLRLIPKL